MDISIITAFVGNQALSEDSRRPAVSLEDGETWSYSELNDCANQYGNALRELGVRSGDRVGILLLNCLEYWALYLGVTKIGAIAVRINFRLAGPELRYIVQDSGCKVICFHDVLRDLVEEVRRDRPEASYVCFPYETVECPSWAQRESWMRHQRVSDATPTVPINVDDPAMLMYTSGTTGLPKGAVWTHGNTLWFGAMQAIQWGYRPTTVALTSGPLYHVGAFEDVLLPALLMRGHAVVTRSRGFSIQRLAGVLVEREVTDALLYPFMIYDLLQEHSLDDVHFPRLRRLVTGGSPIVQWAVTELRRRMPTVNLVQTYGLTEGGGIATAMPDGEGWDRPESVGRPIALTQVRIVDEEFGGPVEVGVVGEVLVRSPAVSPCYWQKPIDSADTFDKGWCKTGDLGLLAEGGYLTITGRKKDMIKSGGENIYPIEVENVLAEHPDVLEAAVIGVPDPIYLEAVCAIVVPRRGANVSTEELVAHCRNHLAGYKKPKYLICVDELPKTASGKVQKYMLRDRYSAIGSSRPED